MLALQFHEAVEPLSEWLSATERRLSSAEPMGTQTSKITQQIVRHKVEYTQQKIDRIEICHFSKLFSAIFRGREQIVNLLWF